MPMIDGLDQHLLRAFLEHVPDGVYFKDRESRFVRISRSLAARFGLKDPADAIGRTDFDMFTEEHARQAFADEQEIVRSGCPIVEKEEKETWANGRETWVLTTKLPWRDNAGKIIGTMGISRDITERKRVEGELQQYRVHLEDLVAQRTVELVRANELLEEDLAERKRTQNELATQTEQLAKANAELENLSLIDDLTGLYNRRGFFTFAEHRLKLLLRSKEPFSIAFVDLDDLKKINDSLGHQEGNHALVETANVLRSCFRESDILARIGGDEFAIFITETDEHDITDRINEQLEVCNAASDRRYSLSLSVGVIIGKSDKHPDIATLLGHADKRMYAHKRAKRVPFSAGSAVR